MRIVLADEQPSRSSELRRILLGAGLVCDSLDAVRFDALAARLAEVEPQLVLVIADGASAAAAEAVRRAHTTTASPILVAGPAGDSQRSALLLEAGARDYLDITNLRDELAAALSRFESQKELTGHRGRIIALFSPSGGAGVTTAAVNLAARLANGRAGQVALVDLKPAPSDLALALDLEPKYTLDQVMSQWHRMDPQLLAAAVARHRSGFDVLAQAGFPAEGVMPARQLSVAGVRQLVWLLRRMYPLSVLDLDHTLVDDQIEAIRQANFVGLVARADVPGLRRARWALDLAVAQGVARDRFRLILNRRGQRGEISRDKAESILGIRVFQSIPDDQASVNRALNTGRVLYDRSRLSRINRSFGSFARNVQPFGGR